jgi:mono/diheme cytochrome c family protein
MDVMKPPLASLAALCLTATALGDGPKPVSYEADVKPILREHCLRCHGDDVHKSDLNLQAYGSTLKGGSGGEVVLAGRPGGSPLYQAIAREGDASPMPPNRPKIPDAQVTVVRQWIAEGLRETPDGAPAMPRRGLEFKAPAPGLDAGPGAMPSGLPTLDLPPPRRPHPVTALATSPRAPLIAIAAHEQIFLDHTQTRERLGALPFPEGVPFVLRFSRDGSVLLAAGGRPVRSGKVVLFDVKSGRRLAEIGDELDSILAADLSPDQEWVALGGTGKVAKVYATRDGRLAYSIARHTDWITGLQFSPDGSKLASADRAGAVHLWEASTGGILLSLSEHKDSVTALDWRGDGQVLATGGEDGKLIFWDAQAGWPSVTLDAPHMPRANAKSRGRRPGGVLSARFASDGRLLTSGRDRMVRLWDGSGKPLATFEVPTALPLKVAATSDGKTLIAGDAEGKLHLWPSPDPSKPRN